LHLKPPLHGYELGDWSDENRAEAQLAVLGRYVETGRAAQERATSVKPSVGR
jgi:4-hydroxy-3-polyprenylbenzoate decarboxylase